MTHDGRSQSPAATDGGDIVFDREAALRRLGQDEELFADMAQFFHEDTPGLLDELEAALRTQDIDQAARSAHTLKGLAANFDGKQAVTLAAEIERRGRAGSLEGVELLARELRHAVERLNAALAPYRSPT
jgi:HPt (histidine-containing phosphotransfer) domain-containing protein